MSTCNLRHLEKSLKVAILLTLSDITSRLGIRSISCRSYNSFPQRFRFFMLCKLSDFTLLKISSGVSTLPFPLIYNLNIQQLTTLHHYIIKSLNIRPITQLVPILSFGFLPPIRPLLTLLIIFYYLVEIIPPKILIINLKQYPQLFS